MTATNPGNRRTLAVVIGVVALLALVALAVIVKTQLIDPGNTTPVGSGQPVAPTLALPVRATTQPASAVQRIAYIRPAAAQATAAATPAALYVSCIEQRGVTPTPTAEAPAATTVATVDSSAVASVAATAAATMPAPDASDYTVFNIAGAASEACYEVGETLPGQGKPFNLAIGVSRAIAGQIAIDKSNLAASQVGQIVIDVSQFTSDSKMRDGQIRAHWLESNKYPQAKLTPTALIGLPSRAYVPGETLHFQISGTLNLHNTDQPVTFDVTAHLADDQTLVGQATTHVRMTDFGITVPDIARFVTANNDVDFVLNLVARTATS